MSNVGNVLETVELLPVGTGVTLVLQNGQWIPCIIGQNSSAPPFSPLSPATIVGNVYIDPQNVTGNASAKGPGTEAAPFQFYAQLAAAWGTVSPLIRASTTLVFLSNHTDNTDPVIWTPYVANSTTVAIQGTNPTVVATVDITVVAAKSRVAGSNSLLEVTLGASGALQQLCQNLTHPSRAFTYALVSGTTFKMSQPFVGTDGVPGTFPAEVNTWTTGDSVELLKPIAVNLVQFSPIYCDTADGSANAVVYQLEVFDPQGPGDDPCLLGDGVNIQECYSQRNLVCTEVRVEPQIIVNVATQSHLAAGTTSPFFLGGYHLNASEFLGTVGPALYGDYIVGATATLGQGGQFGFVYLDAPVVIQAGTLVFQADFLGGGPVVYGSVENNINFLGSSHGTVASGNTFTEVFTMAGAILLNGGTTGSSSVSSGGVATIHTGITLTNAHLDATPAGAAAFAGTAFNLGGAGISNQFT